MCLTAAKFIKQCSFTWMLILSAVMIYIVSFAGVKSGKLKNDISWTRPIFVALFNDDINDGCTEKDNTPVEVVIKDGKPAPPHPPQPMGRVGRRQLIRMTAQSR